ncbi:MAG: hypothetical protein WB765_09925, partial [Acidimicrobiales bacterium]
MFVDGLISVDPSFLISPVDPAGSTENGCATLREYSHAQPGRPSFFGCVRSQRGSPMDVDDLILVSVDDHVVEPPN